MEKEKFKELETENRENLILFLEEYISIFKNNKEHRRIHKSEPCSKCQLAKQLLKKLKEEVKSQEQKIFGDSEDLENSRTGEKKKIRANAYFP